MIERGPERIINVARAAAGCAPAADSGAHGAVEGRLDAAHARVQAEAWSGKGASTPTLIASGLFFATPLTAPIVADPVRWQASAAHTRRAQRRAGARPRRLLRSSFASFARRIT